MKAIISAIFFCLFVNLFVQAQDGSEFDFWVGKWDLSWKYGDGSEGKGTNHITKTLDGKVIQENFEAIDDGPYSGFKGTSISVFNPNTQTWHQAWADNQGGYFNFSGEVTDGKRIFKTSIYDKDGNENILRMRFHEIKEDSFTWDWEQTKDGGKTWTPQWRIEYKRRE